MKSSDSTRSTQPFQLHGKRLWLTRIAYVLIRLVTPTLRWRVHDPHGVIDEITKFPVIYCIWHNRLALSLPIWRRIRWSRRKESRMAAIASASKDGAIVAGMLQLFGAQPVRGSSSRRGVHAMIEMVKWAKQGYDLAVTPDGPRGPKYTIRPGIVSLSQMTGYPILPIAYQLGWKIQLKSWDNFQIPLPFSRCDVYSTGLFNVDADAEDREQIADELREKLMSITHD